MHIFRRLVPHKGRIAIVTDAGRDAVDADGTLDEGAGRGRRSRVVLTPQWLASSFAVAMSALSGQHAGICEAMVTTKPDHQGEREGNR
jgi:hypothetical protein